VNLLRVGNVKGYGTKLFPITLNKIVDHEGAAGCSNKLISMSQYCFGETAS
jgi:hypothetical protein